MNLKLARYRLSRRLTFRGLPISVETDKGELRHWFDPHENKSGTTKMKWPYGYIRRTEGVDGDHVDCYVGPNERAKNVYIVHQMKAPEFKKYDEDKCMLGFLSADEAKKAYLAHYNKPGFFGSMTTMPFEEFEKKVKATFEEPKKIAYDLGVLHALTQLGMSKQAAEMLIGQTMKAVRRALQAKNIDKAHELARLGIQSGTIEPAMLQRFMTPAAGVTSNEAQLWQIASRSAKLPRVPASPAVPTPAPTAQAGLVDPQLASSWAKIKAQQGW